MAECFAKNKADLLSVIRDYIPAIIDGKYEEWIPPDGRSHMALGVINLQHGSVTVRYNTLRPFCLVRRTWRHIQYSPYEHVS